MEQKIIDINLPIIIEILPKDNKKIDIVQNKDLYDDHVEERKKQELKEKEEREILNEKENVKEKKRNEKINQQNKLTEMLSRKSARNSNKKRNDNDTENNTIIKKNIFKPKPIPKKKKETGNEYNLNYNPENNAKNINQIKIKQEIINFEDVDDNDDEVENYDDIKDDDAQVLIKEETAKFLTQKEYNRILKSTERDFESFERAKEKILLALSSSCSIVGTLALAQSNIINKIDKKDKNKYRNENSFIEDDDDYYIHDPNAHIEEGINRIKKLLNSMKNNKQKIDTMDNEELNNNENINIELYNNNKITTPNSYQVLIDSTCDMIEEERNQNQDHVNEEVLIEEEDNHNCYEMEEDKEGLEYNCREEREWKECDNSNNNNFVENMLCNANQFPQDSINIVSNIDKKIEYINETAPYILSIYMKVTEYLNNLDDDEEYNLLFFVKKAMININKEGKPETDSYGNIADTFCNELNEAANYIMNIYIAVTDRIESLGEVEYNLLIIIDNAMTSLNQELEHLNKEVEAIEKNNEISEIVHEVVSYNIDKADDDNGEININNNYNDINSNKDEVSDNIVNKIDDLILTTRNYDNIISKPLSTNMKTSMWNTSIASKLKESGNLAIIEKLQISISELKDKIALIDEKIEEYTIDFIVFNGVEATPEDLESNEEIKKLLIKKTKFEESIKTKTEKLERKLNKSKKNSNIVQEVKEFENEPNIIEEEATSDNVDGDISFLIVKEKLKREVKKEEYLNINTNNNKEKENIVNKIRDNKSVVKNIINAEIFNNNNNNNNNNMKNNTMKNNNNEVINNIIDDYPTIFTEVNDKKIGPFRSHVNLPSPVTRPPLSLKPSSTRPSAHLISFNKNQEQYQPAPIHQFLNNIQLNKKNKQIKGKQNNKTTEKKKYANIPSRVYKIASVEKKSPPLIRPNSNLSDPHGLFFSPAAMPMFSLLK